MESPSFMEIMGFIFLWLLGMAAAWGAFCLGAYIYSRLEEHAQWKADVASNLHIIRDRCVDIDNKVTNHGRELRDLRSQPKIQPVGRKGK